MPAEMTQAQIMADFEDRIGKKFDELREEQLEARKKDLADLAELMRKNAETYGPRTEEPGLRAGRFLRAMAAGRCNIDKALKWANDEGDEKLVKALGESTLSGGGAMVPEELAAEVIEYLRATSVIRSFGPLGLDLMTGSISLPYVGTGITASYVSENSNFNATQQVLGRLNLTARKLAALVPISNDLLRHSRAGGMGADIMVRNDMADAMNSRADLAFIRGDGSADTPMGLLFWVASANKNDATNAAGTLDGSTLAEIVGDLGQAVQQLLDGNIRLANAGWIFAPRTEWALKTQLDSNGNFVFMKEMSENKTLFGFPYKVTTNIPTNLGGSSDASEVYFTDFSQMILADDLALEIDQFDGAAYVDSSGTLVSAVTQDQTVLRALSSHDWGARHRGAEISVIEAVRWTP